MKSLIKTPLQLGLPQRPLQRSPEKRGKKMENRPCFLLIVSTEHFRKALSFSWNTERRRKKTLKLFLKFIFKKFYLFFFTSVVIGIPADKSASNEGEQRFIGSSCCLSTELHEILLHICLNFPRLFNNSLYNIKDRPETLRPPFSVQIQTWHYTHWNFSLTIGLFSEAIRLHSDQDAREKKRKSLCVKPEFVKM